MWNPSMWPYARVYTTGFWVVLFAITMYKVGHSFAEAQDFGMFECELIGVIFLLCAIATTLALLYLAGWGG